MKSFMGFPGSSNDEKFISSAEDLGSVPGLGRFPGGGQGNPLQYSCLENPRGQRSLVGYSPWGRKESDTTEWLTLSLFSLCSNSSRGGLLTRLGCDQGLRSLILRWLLLLSHFSHVRLCVTPSLGFSRQEHWSGLPFPSPMHKSEKWRWSLSVKSDSSRPHGLQPTRLLRPWGFPGKSAGVGCHCLLRLRWLVSYYWGASVAPLVLPQVVSWLPLP